VPLSKLQSKILRVLATHRDRKLDEYTTHAGKRRGHWPTSMEIASAVLERYKGKPPCP
jgi:hypothetical protein